MILFFLSLLAGALTVLAPCVLPLLPVVIVGTAEDSRNKFAPLVIIGSLGLSIILFTLLLKVSTAFITVPSGVWSGISATILVLFGLITLFPKAWDVVATRLKLGRSSNKLLADGYQKKSMWGDVLIGLALGPIFSTCSPTYSVIIASVLPQNIGLGLLDLLAYVAGLSTVLFLIAILGQKFVDKIAFASDPDGWFKKGLGAIFLLLGVLIFFGIDKRIETAIVNSNYFDITTVESGLLKKFNQ